MNQPLDTPNRTRRRAPSAATWIAIAALMVALGGTATAAKTLIGSKDIATGAIKARHLAPGAVTLAKVAPAARASLRGASGPQGPAGPAGGFDPNKLTRVVGVTVTVLPGNVGTAAVTCPAGQKVTGGGFQTDGFQETVYASAPTIDGTGWIVFLDNTAALVTDLLGAAYALCVGP